MLFCDYTDDVMISPIISNIRQKGRFDFRIAAYLHSFDQQKIPAIARILISQI